MPVKSLFQLILLKLIRLNTDHHSFSIMALSTESITSDLLPTSPKTDSPLNKAYFFMQGVSALLPWNSILCTLDFYSAKFPSGNASFTFPVSFFISSVGFNFLMVYIKRGMSLNNRVAGSLALMLIFLILTPVAATSMENSTSGLWVCYLLLFLVGAVNTISNATIAGFSGHFSQECRSIHSAGTGVAALITNAIRALILLASKEKNPSTDVKAIFIFYGVAVLLLVVGIVLHLFFMKSLRGRKELEEECEEDEEVQDQGLKNFKQQWSVFQKTTVLVIAMFVCNVQTFMMFPGVLFQKPTSFANFSWLIVLICSTFNIFDTAAKYVSFMKFFLRKEIVMGVLLVRMIFFVVFIWPVVNPNVTLLSEDWFFLVMIGFFGFTNGLIVSTTFVMIPEKVEGEKKDVAGFLAFNAMICGIMIGSFLALPLQNL